MNLQSYQNPNQMPISLRGLFVIYFEFEKEGRFFGTIRYKSCVKRRLAPHGRMSYFSLDS